jgi:hypothetical protein
MNIHLEPPRRSARNAARQAPLPQAPIDNSDEGSLSGSASENSDDDDEDEADLAELRDHHVRAWYQFHADLVPDRHVRAWKALREIRARP